MHHLILNTQYHLLIYFVYFLSPYHHQKKGRDFFLHLFHLLLCPFSLEKCLTQNRDSKIFIEWINKIQLYSSQNLPLGFSLKIDLLALSLAFHDIWPYFELFATFYMVWNSHNGMSVHGVCVWGDLESCFFISSRLSSRFGSNITSAIRQVLPHQLS